ncbi:hypothetical protein GCM10027403_17370 [Arthrobacter tecti]
MKVGTSAPAFQIRGHHAELRKLPNGARVLAIHDPQARNSTVALSIHAGMRDEVLPEENGTMHLIEHMVYQDSARLSGEDRQRQLARSGSVLGGHTHMDYTEFYETGSTESIHCVADRLVDQVFFPVFRQEQIRQQIEAVATERRRRLAPAPGHQLPWPHLTGKYWRDHANAHDGSGDTDLAERVSPAILQSIHRRLYRPDNTVLVALSPEKPDETVAQLMRAIGVIEPDKIDRPVKRRVQGLPVSQRIDLTEDTQGNRSRRLSATGAAPSSTITPDVLGDLLVAELLAVQAGLDASAGLFGPGDMTDDDLFVVVDDTAFDMDPAERIRAVTVADEELVHHIVARAVSRAEHLTSDDARLTRTVARDVLLRNTTTFATTLVDSLTGLLHTPDDARSLILIASERLAGQPFVCLTLRSQTERPS